MLSKKSGYHVAVDVGGTFTDVFVFDEITGEMFVTKTSSTPSNPEKGIINGVMKAELTGDQIKMFSHGTTVGTNALIERKLPTAALITTKGFRDVPEIRRGTKLDLWDAYNDVAEPYIKRRNRFELDERVDFNGEMMKEVNEAEVRELARILRRKEIKSVAICFMNAYVNGENEQKTKEILQEELPDAYICTSSDTLPEIFEHERMSTTIVNAVLGPTVSKYIHLSESNMNDIGYEGDIIVLHSGGGVMTSQTVPKYAARLASSGIAAGAIASKHIANMCGFKNAIGLDMGGTSTDISLMYDNELRITKDWYIEYGYPIGFPSIEILTIGAGGGSISWIDEGGSLRNGPHSAGADPGPACYGNGGMEPTNTDANLVLGRLNTKLINGEMSLDKGISAKVIEEKVAKPLGYDTLGAANAMIQVANANMCDALNLISVRRGYDPRDFALVAFGGAGALHGADLAREMEIPTVIVPAHPGVAAAMGCLLVDVRHDISKTYFAKAAGVTKEQLENEFIEMDKEATELLAEEGIEADQMNLIRYIDMRYVGQWRTLSVTVDRPIFNLEDAIEKFHLEHEREFAFTDREKDIEIYGLRVEAIGTVKKPQFVKEQPVGTLEDALKEIRPVYFQEEGGMVESKIYDRSKIPVLSEFQGPAIIEQLDSTIVVPADYNVKIDEYRNIIMNRV